jgi:hypothetical protein
MCSNIADIFGYPRMSGNRALDATIGRDRINLAIKPALPEYLTQEDTVDVQTNPKRVTICHIPHGEPKNRHAISAGTYADSEHVHEYSNHKTYHLSGAI